MEEISISSKTGRRQISADERKKRRKELDIRRSQSRIYIGTAIDKWNALKSTLGPYVTHEDVAIHLLKIHDQSITLQQSLGVKDLSLVKHVNPKGANVAKPVAGMGWAAQDKVMPDTVARPVNAGPIRPVSMNSGPGLTAMGMVGRGQVGTVADAGASDTDSSPETDEVHPPSSLVNIPGQNTTARTRRPRVRLPPPTHVPIQDSTSLPCTLPIVYLGPVDVVEEAVQRIKQQEKKLE